MESSVDGNLEPYCVHHECYMEQGHTGDCGKHNVGHTVWECRDALVAQLKDTRYVLAEVSKTRDILMQRDHFRS